MGTDTEEDEVVEETSEGTEGVSYSGPLVTCTCQVSRFCPALLHLPLYSSLAPSSVSSWWITPEVPIYRLYMSPTGVLATAFVLQRLRPAGIQDARAIIAIAVITVNDLNNGRRASLS